MWSFFEWISKPAQPVVKIVGARFPADGSAPDLVPLTTTSGHQGPDCCFSRVPDLRPYWKVPRAWEWRDIEQMTFRDLPNEAWNGVYLKWFSFSSEDLPENRSVPLIFCRVNRSAAGDVFLVKLAPGELDEEGRTAYEDIHPGFLEYCLTRNRMEVESYFRFRDELRAQNALWPGWNQDDRHLWLDEMYRERKSQVITE